MPRLFTAIEIPSDIALHLSMLRGGLPGARWIDPENYHITLRFIGDVDGRTADEVAAALSRVERAPIELRLCGLDAFGGNKPHSLYAGVDAGPALNELQGELERRMQRIGLKAEGRRFVPHVTLARFRGVKSVDIATYLSLRGSFSTKSFRADRFVLLSSRDSVGGGPYVTEETYPLQARAAARSTEWRGQPALS
ncbi:MAG: RNA 2',3'-cyclic phosphodiesterase [Pseudomonadota bacterium]|nr:RNA 2',3'-cyclic phosphodiesterase [Pseudomonadota bacterium]